MKINVAILEDDKVFYDELVRKLNTWAQDKGHQINTGYFSGKKDILSSDFMKKCQLLFADIELKDSDFINGIEVCSKLRKDGYKGEIIFLTSFREYVFHGYDVLAMSYIIKPISDQDLNNCMERFISMHSSNCYYYHKDGKIIQIPYNDIVSISQVGHVCFIQTTNVSYSESNVSLKSFESRLPKQFVRCHRSCIINMHHVTSLAGNTLTVSTKNTQTVGRIYLAAVRNSLLELSEI